MNGHINETAPPLVPIGEVKLVQVQIVVWFVRTCEVWIPFVLHFCIVKYMGEISIGGVVRRCNGAFLTWISVCLTLNSVRFVFRCCLFDDLLVWKNSLSSHTPCTCICFLFLHFSILCILFVYLYHVDHVSGFIRLFKEYQCINMRWKRIMCVVNGVYIAASLSITCSSLPRHERSY